MSAAAERPLLGPKLRAGRCRFPGEGRTASSCLVAAERKAPSVQGWLEAWQLRRRCRVIGGEAKRPGTRARVLVLAAQGEESCLSEGLCRIERRPGQGDEPGSTHGWVGASMGVAGPCSPAGMAASAGASTDAAPGAAIFRVLGPFAAAHAATAASPARSASAGAGAGSAAPNSAGPGVTAVAGGVGAGVAELAGAGRSRPASPSWVRAWAWIN